MEGVTVEDTRAAQDHRRQRRRCGRQPDPLQSRDGLGGRGRRRWVERRPRRRGRRRGHRGSSDDRNARRRPRSPWLGLGFRSPPSYSATTPNSSLSTTHSSGRDLDPHRVVAVEPDGRVLPAQQRHGADPDVAVEELAEEELLLEHTLQHVRPGQRLRRDADVLGANGHRDDFAGTNTLRTPSFDVAGGRAQSHRVRRGRAEHLGLDQVRRPDEVGDEPGRRLVVDRPGRALLDDLAERHHGDPIRHAQRFHLIVGDVQRRDAEAPLEFAQLGRASGRGAWHRGCSAARPGAAPSAGARAPGRTPTAAAAHPRAGWPCGPPSRRGCTAARASSTRCLISARLGPVAFHTQREGDVLEHGHVRPDRVALEHHADVATRRWARSCAARLRTPSRRRG